MAKHSVKVNQPGTPRGAELEVPGLGLVKNGYEKEVDEQQVAQFEAIYNRKWPSDGKLALPFKEGDNPLAVKDEDTEVKPPEEGGED